MKILIWFSKISIFSIVLLFAFNNTDPVILRLLPGFTEFTFQGPLIVWLLVSFILGILLTLLILLPKIIHNWRISHRNGD
tara:strand:+ start:761 stop:1000 length:240 start_codon:yes stop_codon:yes gene_type:complete